MSAYLYKMHSLVIFLLVYIYHNELEIEDNRDPLLSFITWKLTSTNDWDPNRQKHRIGGVMVRVR